MIICGDNRLVLAGIPDNSIDAIVTDPPYGLEFMGKEWDKLRSRKGTKWKGEPKPSIQESNENPYLRAAVHQPATRPLCLRCGKGGSGAWGRCKCKNPLYAHPSFGVEQYEWHCKWVAEAFRIAKPGAYIVAFGGTRTFHRLTCAMEDVGWEIRDCCMWLYGSGFPKSQNVGKTTGDDDWKGWGTALKPAWEPIILARKPLAGTVAFNVLKHGTGALNIDGCRVAPTGEQLSGSASVIQSKSGWHRPWMNDPEYVQRRTDQKKKRDECASRLGRFPANVILSHHPDCKEVGVTTTGKGKYKEGSSSGGIWQKSTGKPAGPVYGEEAVPVYECVEDCPIRIMDEQSGERPAGSSVSGKEPSDPIKNVYGQYDRVVFHGHDDFGGASRFFYTPKASRAERGLGVDVNEHPTVKPIELMRYLCRLITPPNGKVLDPFTGSGSTGMAALLEGFQFLGVEMDKDYAKLAMKRINYIANHPPGEIEGIKDALKTNKKASEFFE
jgi:site-specific DNA-methyltransferase (adenine-specific)